jgi:hypothetical protein
MYIRGFCLILNTLSSRIFGCLNKESFYNFVKIKESNQMSFATTENLNPSSPPALSPDLLIDFNTLSDTDKKLFLKMYNYLWGCVAPAGRFVGYGGVLYTFWAVDLLRSRSAVSSLDLAILTYIYHLTNKGRKFIKSKILYKGAYLFGMSEKLFIEKLSRVKAAGYLARSSYDPARKYNPGLKQKSFISLSSQGVQLIETMEKDLYKILIDGVYNDLTGQHKKTRQYNRV